MNMRWIVAVMALALVAACGGESGGGEQPSSGSRLPSSHSSPHVVCTIVSPHVMLSPRQMPETHMSSTVQMSTATPDGSECTLSAERPDSSAESRPSS